MTGREAAFDPCRIGHHGPRASTDRSGFSSTGATSTMYSSSSASRTSLMTSAQARRTSSTSTTRGGVAPQPRASTRRTSSPRTVVRIHRPRCYDGSLVARTFQRLGNPVRRLGGRPVRRYWADRRRRGARKPRRMGADWNRRRIGGVRSRHVPAQRPSTHLVGGEGTGRRQQWRRSTRLHLQTRGWPTRPFPNPRGLASRDPQSPMTA